MLFQVGGANHHELIIGGGVCINPADGGLVVKGDIKLLVFINKRRQLSWTVQHFPHVRVYNLDLATIFIRDEMIDAPRVGSWAFLTTAAHGMAAGDNMVER